MSAADLGSVVGMGVWGGGLFICTAFFTDDMIEPPPPEIENPREILESRIPGLTKVIGASALQIALV